MTKKSPAVPVRMPLGYTLQGHGRFAEKRYHPGIQVQPQPIRPDRCEPTEARSRDRNLVEIETDGTEGAERVAGQCAGKCGVGIVGFVGEVLDVDCNLHSFYPV